MNKETENQLWQTVEILFDHFRDKPSYTRQDVAKALGDVHTNTIYKDELILIDWCDHYTLNRRQRLTSYHVWLLCICRVLVHHFGKSFAGTFFFNHSDLLTLENFKQFKERTDVSQVKQIRRVSAA